MKQSAECIVQNQNWKNKPNNEKIIAHYCERERYQNDSAREP